LADGARSTKVVAKAVVLSGALRKSLPSSVGIDFNSVTIDTSRAAALLPRDSGSATGRSSVNDSSSRSGGYGVDTRRRPLAGGATDSSHLEGDGISTAVNVVAEVV